MIKQQKHSATALGCVIIVLSLFVAIHAVSAQPVVRIVCNPDLTDIRIEKHPQKIGLIAEVDTTSNRTFAWRKLDGLGTLKGEVTGQGIFYIPPERIEGEAASVIISVTVTDKNSGTETTVQRTFTLRASAAESPAKSVEQTEQPANANEDKIAKMLSACAQHVQAKRLTSGKGGNAADCYDEVLTLDPTNADALAGLQSIEARYAELIRQALQKHDLKKAQQYLTSLRTLNPESPKLAELEAEIQDQASSVSLWNAAIWNQSRWQ